MRYQEFSALAVSYLAQLYNTARRLTGEAHEAEDLVQDTYQRAFQQWRQLRDPTHCRAWLYQIMRNLCIDAHRRKRTLPELVVIEGKQEMDVDAFSARISGLEEELLHRISAAQIQRAITSLPEELRTALVLCDIEGLTYGEIARVMECPLGTVRSRIARARHKLLMRLGAHSDIHEVGRKREH